MKYSNEELRRMHKVMVSGRLYCEKHEKILLEGRIGGFCHLGQGQEAIGAGTRAAMKESDWYLPTHRSQTGQIFGLDLKKVVAEQCGKVTGYCNGIACDYHLSVPEKNLMFANGILGQNFPIAVGFAHALKRAGKKQVIVAVEGDGAFSEGVNYEALIFADRIQVPVVFIVEDNGYAVSYKSSTYKKRMAERAEAFGINAVTVDGNDVLAVREAVEAAIESARENKPAMVECKTLRWGGHYAGGDAQIYRDKTEVEHAKKNNDPIKRFEKVLLDLDISTQKQIAEVWDNTKKEIDEAFDEALELDYPGKELILDRKLVYANPWEE